MPDFPEIDFRKSNSVETNGALEGIARTDNKFTNTASITNYKEQYDMKDWA